MVECGRGITYKAHPTYYSQSLKWTQPGAPRASKTPNVDGKYVHACTLLSASLENQDGYTKQLKAS